jgi:small subunit ribosomal protein S21
MMPTEDPKRVASAGQGIGPTANVGCPLADVKLQEGETLESALRRFKKKVMLENIIGEVKRHAFYLKPGQKRRVKSALARKRNRKKARREAE